MWDFRATFPEGFLPRPAGNSGVVPNADPRPAAMAWKDDERFAVQAANVGLDIILCPAHFLYLDIVQDLNFEDKLLARNRQIGKFYKISSLSVGSNKCPHDVS